MLKDNVILSLSPFIIKPFIHGAVTRIYYLNRGLAAVNRLFLVHRSQQEQAPIDFGASGVANGSSRGRQIFSPGLVRYALNLIKQEKVTLILANHIWTGLHGLILSRLAGVPFIFDNHNVEYIRFKRIGSPLWPGIWGLEKLVCAGAGRILCVSETDRLRLAAGLSLNPARLQVIENGVDVAGLRAQAVDRNACRAELGLEPDEGLFLFYGSFTYAPNVVAARLLVDEIAPRLVKQGGRGKIILIGNGPRPLHSNVQIGSIAVERLGFVDDLIRYIKSADVLLAPLTAGSGTRFKILETLACQTPVVTTTIGAEGLDQTVCGPTLYVCDDWGGFAEAAMVATQSNQGDVTAAFVAKYDWEQIVAKITL